jgi:uncharacterized LabA/DUF88 family protein
VDRFAVFVDGGYLAAAAAMHVLGTPKRHLVRLDLVRMRQALLDAACDLARPATPLRLYWYDACIDGVPSPWHEQLAHLPDVKLRLGKLRGTPLRQKGVDTLLVHDLLVLAQERSITDAVLVTGDEDMREAVSYAQERGVRVHLVVGSGSDASWTLRQEADTVTVLMPDRVRSFTRAAPQRGSH